jgi:proteic killer suppression protein
MIQSFADNDTEKLANHIRVKRFEKIERIALRKLILMEVAKALSDLAIPPGNCLKSLDGDRTGQHSIRINDQYRICFVWTNSGPSQVEIVDYH